MRFRPCIDIHNGKVKQIVGGSLKDESDYAAKNFESDKGADYYAHLYRRDGLRGGHVIMLNPPSSAYYGKTKEQAVKALGAYPGGLQLGGGVTASNALEYLRKGASHVIVTSYVFEGGHIHWDKMEQLKTIAGKERLVIDLSCRKRDGGYYIVTDRWQRFTDTMLNHQVLDRIARYCDEVLVHGVDAEGHSSGVEEELVAMLGSYEGLLVTYAGGIGSMKDLDQFRSLSGGKIDFTVGSALDLFGGKLPYDVVKNIRIS